jgi:hypothetical protein
MRKALLLFAAVLAMMVNDAFAGGFGFSNVAVNVGGNVQVQSVNRFGLLGLRRNVVNVQSNGFATNVRSFNTGPFGLLRFNRSNVNVVNGGAAVAVNVNNRGFFGRRNNVNVAVNGRGFNNNAVFFNNGFRVNSFGTRTVVDGVGNVFEVDAFGNSRFRGNSFGRVSFSSSVNRGFVNTGFVNTGFSSGFVNTGFNNGFRSFSGCGSY